MKTTELPIVLTSAQIVKFSDCDPFGHLNNARHIDYLLSARDEQLLENYAFNLNEYMRKGYGWVVASHEIAYLKPAGISEKIFIETSLIEWADSHLYVEMLMFNKGRTQLKTILWTKFVFFSLKTGQKEQHSQELQEFFGKLVNHEISLPGGIQGRIRQLKDKKV